MTRANVFRQIGPFQGTLFLFEFQIYLEITSSRKPISVSASMNSGTASNAVLFHQSECLVFPHAVVFRYPDVVDASQHFESVVKIDCRSSRYAIGPMYSSTRQPIPSCLVGRFPALNYAITKIYQPRLQMDMHFPLPLFVASSFDSSSADICDHRKSSPAA